MLFATYFFLTRLHLYQYAAATGNLLLRHWLWYIFLVAIFVPQSFPFHVILLAAAGQLASLFVPGMGLGRYLICLLTVQSIAVGWIVLQRRQIRGADFMQYISALPISATTRRCVDFTLLLAANNILLVPFLIAFVRVSVYPETKGAFEVAALTIFLCVTLAAQLAALEKRPVLLLEIMLLNVPMALGLAFETSAASWPLLALALLGASALIAFSHQTRLRSLSRADSHQSNELVPSPRWSVLSPALGIYIKILAGHPVAMALRTGMAFCLAWAASLLAQGFEYDSRSLPAAVLALAAISLVLGGTYRILNTAHAPLQDFFAALPLGKRYWLIRDSMAVVLLGIMPFIILMVPLVSHGVLSWGCLLALGFGYTILIFVMRAPIQFGGQQAVFLSLLLAGTWAAAAIAAVHK